MAEANTTYEGASTGQEHGSYFYDDSYFDEFTSGKVVYNYSYQDNFDFFPVWCCYEAYLDFSGHAFNTVHWDMQVYRRHVILGSG